MKQTPHRVKEERFPPAAVTTMPLNQAAVTLTGGRGGGGFSLGPAVGRGGLEDVAPLPHIVSALVLSFPPPPLSVRRLRLLSAASSLCRPD